MKNRLPFLLLLVPIVFSIFSACTFNRKSLERSRTEQTTNCQSPDFPNFKFSESNIFPKDKSLHRPEDGKALPDGRIIVSDQESGLRVIKEDGENHSFGKFKEGGYTYHPPKFSAGPQGIFIESDDRHLLVSDVFNGKIYRVDSETEETKMIYDHPYGINNLIEDSKGTIWFTQSAKNGHRKGAEELFAAIDRPVDSGAVFYLRSSGNDVRAQAVAAARNIYFANGIALDKAEKYLYVAETMMNRILRFEIDVSKSTLTNRETYEHVTTPDNIEFDKDGNLWIASPISNQVFAIDQKCRSLHTVFTAPSESNAKVQEEWTQRSDLGKPLLELLLFRDLWKPLPGGILTGMFWSKDHKTFYVTGTGNALLKYKE